MGERRSARSHKQVNYAKFEDELDDDFEDLTPPNKKQKKTDVREGVQKEKKREDMTITHSVDIEMKKTAAKTKRVVLPPVEEEMYQQDMQAALQLSLLTSSQNGGDGTSEPIYHSTPLRKEASSKKHKEPDEAKVKETQSTVPLSGVFGVPDTDEIEFLGTVDDDNTSKTRRQAAVRKKTYSEDDGEGSDEDFRVREHLSADDSDCSETGSDFDNRKAKAKHKASTSKKTSAEKSPSKARAKQSKKCEINSQHHPVSVPFREHEAVAAVASSQLPSSVSRTSQALSGSRGRAAVCRKPAWTPPSQNDGSKVPNSVALKSPSSGLRLGLSRHARIKSLHPSPKVS